MIAAVATAFALGGQELEPLQRPIGGAVIAAILDVVPDPERDLQQFIPQSFGIVNRIVLAAELHPPVAHAPEPVAVGTVG